MYPMPNADAFDPERWELPGNPTPLVRRRKPKARGSGRQGKFLKGPISWTWIHQAMHLPGKSLAVGLMLWRESGCAKNHTVRFCLARAEVEGIPTTTARRAIRALERAGLVRIVQQPGRGLEVTILVDSA
jgi:hypothetical protein